MFEQFCEIANKFLEMLPGDCAMYLMLSFWFLVCVAPILLVGGVGAYIGYRWKNRKQEKE